ncbi:MAG: cytochrome c, partial [Nitrospirae bacterium]|nr:cytochrome c [Nitrospirota bacterium]
KDCGKRVPDRKLTVVEERGLHVYVERECAYCHQIQGRGGHRTGPDLANITAKGKTAGYLSKFVKDPQAVRSSSIMPRYDLPEEDRRALAEFMLALDFSKYPLKIMKREDVLKSWSRPDTVRADLHEQPGARGHFPEEVRTK